MYAAASKPVAATDVPAGRANVGRAARPRACGWRSRSAGSPCRPGGPPRSVLHAVGLGQLKPSVLDAVVPGWGSPGSLTLADPGPAGGAPGPRRSCR